MVGANYGFKRSCDDIQRWLFFLGRRKWLCFNIICLHCLTEIPFKCKQKDIHDTQIGVCGFREAASTQSTQNVFY